jgi:hypothetical protein
MAAPVNTNSIPDYSVVATAVQEQDDIFTPTFQEAFDRLGFNCVQLALLGKALKERNIEDLTKFRDDPRMQTTPLFKIMQLVAKNLSVAEIQGMGKEKFDALMKATLPANYIQILEKAAETLPSLE